MQLKKGPVLVGAAIRLPYGEAVDSGTTLEGCFWPGCSRWSLSPEVGRDL